MNGVSTVVESSEGDDKQPVNNTGTVHNCDMTSRILPPHDVTGKVADRTIMSCDHQKRAGTQKSYVRFHP